jgi:hypothetical protein
VCSDVTRGCDGPSLGLHIAHGVKQDGTVLPNNVRLPSGGPVDHAVRWDGMGCHDRLIVPMRGASTK